MSFHDDLLQLIAVAPLYLNLLHTAAEKSCFILTGDGED